MIPQIIYQQEYKKMEGWKCEWYKDCPNKAAYQLVREGSSTIVGDSFAAGVALPPVPQMVYLKVCAIHFSEASISFLNGAGFIKPLTEPQIDYNQYKPQIDYNQYKPKKCTVCQTTYPDSFLSYCTQDGGLLETME